MRRKSRWCECGFNPQTVFVGDRASVIGRLCGGEDAGIGIPDRQYILEELVDDKWRYCDSGRTSDEPDPWMQGWVTTTVVTLKEPGTRRFRLVFEGDDEYEPCVGDPFPLVAISRPPAKGIYT